MLAAKFVIFWTLAERQLETPPHTYGEAIKNMRKNREPGLEVYDTQVFSGDDFIKTK